MVLSKYNRYIKKENDILVYNVKFENAISFPNQKNLLSLKEYMVNCKEEEFKNLGFVVDYDEIENEKKHYLQMKHNENKKMNIMLIMTYSCNCACRYCFENLQIGNKKKEKTDDVIQYLIDLYHKNECESMDFHFFGGEPLLKVDQMIYIYKKLRDLKINVKPNVITNGTLLNKDNAKNLIENGISTFQITIDGPKYIHDIRRPMKNGESSWDNIISNITYLSKLKASISIRVNIDSDNVEYLEEICKSIPSEVLKNPYTYVYISPVVGCKIKNLKETLEKRTSFMKRAWQIIYDKNLPVAIKPPVYAPCPYDSYESAFYIDLYGNVYTCGGFVGKPNKIEREFGNKSDKFKKRIEYEPDEKCFECTYFPVCIGGCKFETETLGGKCQKAYLTEVYDEYYSKYAAIDT